MLCPTSLTQMTTPSQNTGYSLSQPCTCPLSAISSSVPSPLFRQQSNQCDGGCADGRWWPVCPTAHALLGYYDMHIDNQKSVELRQVPSLKMPINLSRMCELTLSDGAHMQTTTQSGTRVSSICLRPA